MCKQPSIFSIRFLQWGHRCHFLLSANPSNFCPLTSAAQMVPGCSRPLHAVQVFVRQRGHVAVSPLIFEGATKAAHEDLEQYVGFGVARSRSMSRYEATNAPPGRKRATESTGTWVRQHWNGFFCLRARLNASRRPSLAVKRPSCRMSAFATYVKCNPRRRHGCTAGSPSPTCPRRLHRPYSLLASPVAPPR
jgi:hypothetical protein